MIFMNTSTIKKIKKKIKLENKELVFKNVFFKYPGDKNYILNKINLNISYPNSISITGNSGCGKTTFVDLLTGLLSCKWINKLT